MTNLANAEEDRSLSTAQGWIGKKFYAIEAEIKVGLTSIRSICAASYNANPLFWDEAKANEITGGFIAPPSSVSGWLRPHFWSPNPNSDARALKLHFDLKEVFGVPEGVMVDNELTLFAPVRLGQRLRTYQMLHSISEEKKIKLGRGRFWVIDVVIENEQGERCAVDRYTGLGYRKTADA